MSEKTSKSKTQNIDNIQGQLTQNQKEKLQELSEINKTNLSNQELTHRVRLSLRRKYSRPEWGLFFELVGKNQKRADAIAYNLYPSRNFKTIGFEIKTSRSDWKKELRNIEKNDWFVGQVNEWYLVSGRKDIVRESELPQGWGLYEMKGGGKLYKIADSNPTKHQDRPVDREFYMRPLQKALKDNNRLRREKKRVERKAYREGKKEGKKEGGITRKQKQLIEQGKDLQRLENELDISFFNIDNGLLEKLGCAVNIVESLDPEKYGSLLSEIEVLREKHEKVGEEMEGLEEDLRQLKKQDIEVER